jgi:DNA-directed RNA polymerase beta subunit
LQKFVATSVYSIDIGPTDIITRQPLDGKANQGGLRISELQRDVLISQGCSRWFSEKFFNDSDDFEVYYCRCGNVAIVNKTLGIYECQNCGDDADVYAIHSSWSSKQLFMELNAMHIGTLFQLEPFTFYEGL